MARNVSNVNILTDTWEILLLQTNELLNSLSSEIVTANTSYGITGNTALPRNAELVGTFGANTIVVTDSLRGGNVAGAFSTLNIISSVSVSNTSSATINLNVANGVSNVVATPTTLTIGNTTSRMSLTSNVISTTTPLRVTNATSFSNGVAIVGAVNTSNTMDILGATVIANNLSVAGDVILSGNVTFGSAVTLTNASLTSLNVANSFIANATHVTVAPSVRLVANGSTGSVGQTLTTNGSAIYWATANTSSPIALPVANTSTSFTSPLQWSSAGFDVYAASAQSANLTISADSGNPVDGQKTVFRFKDNGTSRTLTWTTGASNAFREIGTILPTTTVVNKITYVGCIYNAPDSRWDVVAVITEN